MCFLAALMCIFILCDSQSLTYIAVQSLSECTSPAKDEDLFGRAAEEMCLLSWLIGHHLENFQGLLIYLCILRVIYFRAYIE